MPQRCTVKYYLWTEIDTSGYENEKPTRSPWALVGIWRIANSLISCRSSVFQLDRQLIDALEVWSSAEVIDRIFLVTADSPQSFVHKFPGDREIAFHPPDFFNQIGSRHHSKGHIRSHVASIQNVAGVATPSIYNHRDNGIAKLTTPRSPALWRGGAHISLAVPFVRDRRL